MGLFSNGGGHHKDCIAAEAVRVEVSGLRTRVNRLENDAERVERLEEACLDLIQSVRSLEDRRAAELRFMEHHQAETQGQLTSLQNMIAALAEEWRGRGPP